VAQKNTMYVTIAPVMLHRASIRFDGVIPGDSGEREGGKQGDSSLSVGPGIQGSSS